jgi:hypothetical protein
MVGNQRADQCPDVLPKRRCVNPLYVMEVPEDFLLPPNSEFMPSYPPTIVNGDGNFQHEFN